MRLTPPDFDPDPDEFGFGFEPDDEAPYHREPRHESSSRRESRSLSVVFRLWNPVPIPMPTVDPEFRDLPWLERSVEVIRFTLLSVEHWLSQRGVLREWIRLNLWFAVVLTVAAVLIIPPVTAVLEGAAEWTGLIGNVIENVTEAVLKLPPVVIGIATLLVLFRLGWRQWHSNRGRRASGFDDYR